MLAAARAGGATAAETEVSQAVGQSVTVRNGEVETISYNRDKGIGVTVFIGQRRGHASTADFAADAIDATVAKALAIARYTAQDPAAGLADPDRLARTFPDLDLYHPWDLSVEGAIAMGREAEAAALAVDRRLVNTEGSSVARGESEFVYANSNGFCAGYRSSRHHIDCSVIGDPGDGAMQRDYWYTAARAASDLEPAATVGRIAGERTARRLGARQVPTQECPVLFEAPEAADLIGYFVGAVSGGALYRKSSFLPDSLGTQVFAPQVSIREEPHLLARPRQRAVRQRRGRDLAPRRRARRHRPRLLSRQLFGAQARPRDDRPTRAATTISSSRHGDDDLPALLRRMGRGLSRHRAAGSGRQSGDRRFLARRGRILDRGRRDRVPGRGNHDRRQPQGRCSATSSPSAPTSTADRRGTPGRSSSAG